LRESGDGRNEQCQQRERQPRADGVRTAQEQGSARPAKCWLQGMRAFGSEAARAEAKANRGCRKRVRFTRAAIGGINRCT
jgi:hypothetical protein